MKNCEYYEELIGAALDGEITAEEDKELRAHLESCEACRSFYEAMQAISGTDDALGDVPENFTANVMARVHEAAAPAEKPAKKKASIQRLVTRCGALAAAAAVAIWAGVTFSGTFAAKGASSTAREESEIAMYSAAEDSAETERAARDAAPAEAPVAPAGGRMMAAAPDSAAADGSVTVTVTTAENGASDDAVTLPDDGFFAGYLLLDEGETPTPERGCDYTITLDAPDGTESVYRLWVEEESLVWQKADGDAAHLSPASPEAWSEILRNASR